MVRSCYPEIDFIEIGLWARIPSFVIPADIWTKESCEIAFQFPDQLPGQQPYGFYARPQLTLEPDGATPENYVFPAQTPWGNDWGKFSWQLGEWAPAASPPAGSNMLNFVRSFCDRFQQGR